MAALIRSNIGMFDAFLGSLVDELFGTCFAFA